MADCSYAALPPGATVHAAVTGTVDTALVDGSNLANQVGVFSSTFDPNAADNSGIAANAVAGLADGGDQEG